MQCQTGFHLHFFCPGNSTAMCTRVPIDTPTNVPHETWKGRDQFPLQQHTVTARHSQCPLLLESARTVTPRIYHSQSPPLPGFPIILGNRTFRPSYPFYQILTRMKMANNSCASIEAGLTKITYFN